MHKDLKNTIMNTLKNIFEKGAKYAAAQNISIKSLANGNAPLFYESLTYIGVDDEQNPNEHIFDYHGEMKWFDDAFINNGKTGDNSMIFSILNKQ